MVPRGALYFYGGAAAVPPAAAMKSRLAETAAPLPAPPAPAPAEGEEEGISDDFSVEDFFVDDGAESPGTEVVEKGKGVVFEAAAAAAVGTSLLVAPAAAVAPELSDISLPEHDPSEFEWVSLIIDDSLHPPSPGVPPCRLATPTKMLPRVQPPEHRRPFTIPEYRHLGLYRPPPPPERLCNLSTESHVPIKAKRSKRPQPRRSLSLSDSASSAIYSPSSSSSSGSSFSSSSPPHAPAFYRNAIVLYDGNEHRSSKKTCRKPNRPPRQDVEVTDRRCSHCGSQKTPQWRTGPQGPKTLCNACGVRFKSGRLMPEYRPAASPSFNSHVHANSHRKVMEIRRKKEEHRQYRPVPPPVESY